MRHEDEVKTLRDLQRIRNVLPPRHINLHYSAWSQGEEFNILFPFADMDLHSFMQQVPWPNRTLQMPYHGETKAPQMDKKFVLWLLQQFCGLADALKSLHSISMDNTEHDASRLDESQWILKGNGYQVDIKPINILIFLDGGYPYGTFKFADIGASRFTEETVNAGSFYSEPRPSSPIQSPPQERTIAYEASERYERRLSSRPADVWSLGCVYLDLLNWCFYSNSRSLAVECLEDAPDSLVKAYSFWMTTEDGTTVTLKPAVQHKFRSLEEDYCRGNTVLESLLQTVQQMLIIDKDLRITSSELVFRLRNIYEDAKVQLERDPTVFLRIGPRWKTNLTTSEVPRPRPDGADVKPRTSSREA